MQALISAIVLTEGRGSLGRLARELDTHDSLLSGARAGKPLPAKYHEALYEHWHALGRPKVISTTPGAQSSRTDVETCTWPSFIQRLTPTSTPHKDGPGWIPGEAIKRGLAGLRWIWFAVFDLDTVTDAQMSTILTACEPYRYLLHSTWSHRPGTNKLRLILPLWIPIAPTDYQRLWADIASTLLQGVPDPQTKDPARMYYLPSHQPDVTPIYYAHEGAELDPRPILLAAALPATPVSTPAVTAAIEHITLDQRLARAQQYLDAMPHAIQGQHGEVATRNAIWVGSDFGIPSEQWWPILQNWNRTAIPPWEEFELQRKLAADYRTAQYPFGAKLLERAAPAPGDDPASPFLILDSTDENHVAERVLAHYQQQGYQFEARGPQTFAICAPEPALWQSGRAREVLLGLVRRALKTALVQDVKTGTVQAYKLTYARMTAITSLLSTILFEDFYKPSR